MMYKPETKEHLQATLLHGSMSLKDIDTSLITDMSELFKDTKRKDFTGIELWDTSNVKSMRSMFENVYKFNADISKWDVSKVENMDSMFSGATRFNYQQNQVL